ncbi:hypothetical protein AcV5_007584 [Taiwanofungus camphoratus]|nr:hypothetical protein AcV5_007584 [Antrodia cinnamomea]
MPLPPEITDRIIDFLWDDAPALYACSLTCRSWTAASRYHLITTLRIGDRSAFDSLAHFAQHDPRAKEYLDYAREIIIYDSKPRPFAHLVLQSFGRHMSKVRSIRLYNAFWKNMPLHRTFPMLVAQFVSVSQVYLETCLFHNLSDLKRLVCALPQLEVLFVGGSETFFAKPPQFQAYNLRIASSPRLTTLRLSLRYPKDITHICEWLVRTASIRTIRTLDVWGMGREWHKSLGDLLQAIGANLQHLELPHCIVEEEDCDLTHNPSLVSLAISRSEVEAWSTTWFGITRTLSQITSSCIRKLTFTITVCRDPDEVSIDDILLAENDSIWDKVDWERINQISARKNLLSLEEVHIVLHWDVWSVYTHTFDGFKRDMTIRLQRLDWHRRGILKISDGSL